eukprot:g51183.t1
MNQVILQRYISITKVAAHCSNERSRKHYLVTKMQNDIDTIHKPPCCCKLTSPQNFKGIYGGCPKNPVRNRRGSHSLRSDAVQTARTILAPACAFVVGIATGVWAMEVKSKMKLIGYRKDEASSIFWLLQQEDKKQVWKPDAEMTRHAEWVALSSRISIPNDFVLGCLSPHMVQYFDGSGNPGKIEPWKDAPPQHIQKDLGGRAGKGRQYLLCSQKVKRTMTKVSTKKKK